MLVQMQKNVLKHTGMIFAIRPGVWPSLLLRMLRRKMPLDYRFLNGRAFLPSQISIDLTYRCNTCCIVCCQSGPDVCISPGKRAGHEFLDKAAFEKVLKEMRIKQPTIYLTGGEPLLHPEAPAMIALARSMGFYVSINTNGILLEQYARELVKAGVNRVILSVSPTPELCWEERKIQYDCLEQGAKKLRSVQSGHRPILSLTCVVTPANCRYLDKLAGMAREFGADNLVLQHLMFSDETLINAHAAALKLEFGEHAAYSGLLASKAIVDLAILQKEINILRSAGARLRLEPDIPRSKWPAYYSAAGVDVVGRCLAPWTTLVLMPDGGLSCCRPLRLGQAGVDRVQAIWNSPKAVMFRRRIKQELLPGCARCCAREYRQAGHG